MVETTHLGTPERQSGGYIERQIRPHRAAQRQHTVDARVRVHPRQSAAAPSAIFAIALFSSPDA